MASEQDEALYWPGRAIDAHHNVLDTVQTSTGKWRVARAVNAGRKLTPFHRRAQGIRATARRANDCELTRPGGSLGTAPDVAAT